MIIMGISSESKKSSTAPIVNHERDLRASHLCWHKSTSLSRPLVIVLLLLHMIDCSQCAVYDGPGSSTPNRSTSGSSLPESKHVGPGLMTMLKPVRQQQQQASINQSLASTQAVNLMKRSTSSSLGKVRSESVDWDGLLVSEPGEINELRVKTMSPQVVSRPSTSTTATVTEAATVGVLSSVLPGNESLEDPGRIEAASSESASDSKEDDCNLLDKVKSFFETVSEKIILCVNNLKGYQRKVELDNVNNDQRAGLEGRPSGRLSKSEIMQIIIDDFNLGVDAINHDNNENTRKRADETLDKSSNDVNQTNSAISVDERRPIGSQASNDRLTTGMKSLTDKFKDRLNSILDDDKVVILHGDASDSITIDLDFLKLQKRESAQSHSFPPIEQLKKVMNFMHFG